MDNMLYIIAGILVYLIIRKVTAPKVENINSKELKELLSDKSVKRQFVDVRTEGEFSSNKIKGFKNIPLQSIKNRVSELNKDLPIVLICASGSRSMGAARVLSKAGFTDLVNVRGGMSMYR